MTTPKTINTERLLLRPFTIDDIDAVVRFGSNKATQEKTGDVLITTRDHAAEIIEGTWLNEYATYGYARMAVVHQGDQELIGFCGLKHIPQLGVPDIGYRFLPEYWGQGIATESSRALITHGFDHQGIDLIKAFTMVEHVRSIRVLEKLGFEFEKHDHYPGEEKNIYNWFQLKKDSYERH
ncbi:GNAT family N-acetyltransferase [Flavobacteriaceae bacterium]|nr:GNAT family N-acetyltransferase [Flavobacteriaceae bacterium]MDC0637215.1 GNAT family N-acetyltransferase [Flavobacteriaceae bacterium]